MVRTAYEKTKEKFALVYEYNKTSPLFVRAAEVEMDKNNFQNAADILSEGIKGFPDYPTAYILLGKVLIQTGDFEQAEAVIEKGCNLLGCKCSYNHYINELENQKRLDIHYSDSRRIAFFDKKLLTEEQKPEIQESIEFSPESEKITESEIFEEKKNNIDENLDNLVKEISSAKLIISDEPKETPVSNPVNEQKPEKNDDIVTETLAKIYISQGKFREAIDVYKKLLIKTPDKKDYYSVKIGEIKSQLEQW